MKNYLIKSLVFTISHLLTSFSFSQGFQVTSLTSDQNGYLICDSTVNLSFSAGQYANNSGADIDLLINGTNFQASQFQVTIKFLQSIQMA
jgi:hypothetical protein